MTTEDEQLRRLRRLEYDVAQLEHRIEEQDVEIQNLRAAKSRSQAALAEVQAENKLWRDKALRFDLDQAGIERREVEAAELVELRAALVHCRQALERNQRPEFLPPCELKSMERGVYEELVDGGERIERKPTRELRILLRQPFENEVIEGHKYELKVIPVWVRK